MSIKKDCECKGRGRLADLNGGLSGQAAKCVQMTAMYGTLAW